MLSIIISGRDTLSFHLHGESPWNKSNERDMKLSVKKLLARPKEFPENGRSVLSKPEVCVGI